MVNIYESWLRYDVPSWRLVGNLQAFQTIHLFPSVKMEEISLRSFDICDVRLWHLYKSSRKLCIKACTRTPHCPPPPPSANFCLWKHVVKLFFDGLSCLTKMGLLVSSLSGKFFMQFFHAALHSICQHCVYIFVVSTSSLSLQVKLHSACSSSNPTLHQGRLLLPVPCKHNGKNMWMPNDRGTTWVLSAVFNHS